MDIQRIQTVINLLIYEGNLAAAEVVQQLLAEHIKLVEELRKTRNGEAQRSAAHRRLTKNRLQAG